MARSGNKTAKSADEWLVNGSDGEGTADSKETGGNGDDFVPEGRKEEHPPPDRGESIGAETAQWVVEPAAKLNGGKPTVPAQAPAKEVKAAATPAEDGKESKETRDLAKRLRELQTQLRMQEKEAKGRVDQATVELAKRHDNREQRLTDAFEKQRDELTRSFQEQRDELTKSFEGQLDDQRLDFEDREAELRARIDELESELTDAKKRSGQRKGTAAAAKSTGRRKSAKDDGLSLNESTFEELRDLGLTVTQSARVIAYRDVRGGFESLDELDEIPGLSKEIRSDLRKRLSLSS